MTTFNTKRFRALMMLAMLVSAIAFTTTSAGNSEALTLTPPTPVSDTYEPIMLVDQGATKVAGTATTIERYNLCAAAQGFLIDPWIFRWESGDSYSPGNVVSGLGLQTETILNEDGKEVTQITQQLEEWEAFWIRAWPETKLSVLFRFSGKPTATQKSNDPFLSSNSYVQAAQTGLNEVFTPSGVAVNEIGGTDGWNFISIPMLPTDKNPLSSIYNGIFAKWSNTDNWNETQFDENENLPDLIPGRGFWYKGSPLSLSGSETVATQYVKYYDYYLRKNMPEFQYCLDIDVFGSQVNYGYGDYMIGNPNAEMMVMENVYIQKKDGYQLAKPVADNATLYEDLKAIQYWKVDLTLSDATGAHLDNHNAAGVIESGKDLHTWMNAPDMVAPKNDIVRLAFVNPDDAQSLLAWDYRAAGQDKYEWNVQLSTTINSIATKLSLANFANIPSDYLVTLTDTQSGQVYTLTGDTSIDVALASSAPKSFVLTATRQKPVAVEEAAPVALALKNIFPNPFNPSTTISFDVKKAGMVNLGVYNISGQLVETLVNSSMSAGSHSVNWNATKHSSGVYIVRLTANGFTDTKKVTFMK